MKLLLLLMISLPAESVEYFIDSGLNNVNYSWYGVGSDNASYDKQMVGVGFSALHDNFGLRAGVMKGGEANTEGRYSTYIVNMKSITSFELFYKKDITDRFYLFTGIGHYLIPVPIYSEEDNYYRNDNDNDGGWFYGINIRLSNDFSLKWRHTQYGTIKNSTLNEWIKGDSLSIVYRL